MNQEVEAMGVKILAQYAVLGPYDFVNIVEAPDTATVMKISVNLGARGTVQVMSLAAMTLDDYIATVASHRSVLSFSRQSRGKPMAFNAYILINVEPARTQPVIKQLQKISSAVVHEVLGPYDVVVDLEAGTPEDITVILRNKIRPIHGITNTVTCMCL